MLKLALGSVSRQLGSVLSGWVLAHGLAAQGDAETFATVLVSILIYGAMQAWSLLHKSGKVKA